MSRRKKSTPAELRDTTPYQKLALAVISDAVKYISNTARAHERNRELDWIASSRSDIYFDLAGVSKDYLMEEIYARGQINKATLQHFRALTQVH